MTKIKLIAGVLLFWLMAMGIPMTLAHAGGGPTDILLVTGTITNDQGKPLKDATLQFFLNGKKIHIEGEVTTSKSGGYKAELTFLKGSLAGAKVQIEVEKPSFKNSGHINLKNIVWERSEENELDYYLAHSNITLARVVTPAFWIASLVLIVVYMLIAFELMHRTLAAFLGASVLLTVTYTAGSFNPNFVILTYEEAIHAIDMNVIFLLMAMMMIVGVMKKTGVFQWMAYKSYQIARGNVFVLAAILMFVTAVTSAFLDNVTTMLLIIPVTIEIALTLKINPIFLLMPEVFASNVGGTATLIGDPPNIMIGSYAKLSFVDFIMNLSLVNVIGLAITIVYFLFWYKKDYLMAHVGDVGKIIEKLRNEYKITNKSLLIQCGIILGIVIFLFIIHGILHMEPSIAAMIGASILMVISKVDIVKRMCPAIPHACPGA